MMPTNKDSPKQATTGRSNMLWLLQSKHFSDFEIHCGENTVFYVHRTVIAHNCEFFKTLTTSTFKEGLEQKVTLQDEEPGVIARLIYFIYTGWSCLNYKLNELDIEQFLEVDETVYDNKRELYCIDIYASAIKFGISDLAHQAAREYIQHSTGRSSIDSMDWEEEMKRIYSSTPQNFRVLRDFLVREYHFVFFLEHNVEFKILDRTWEATLNSLQDGVEQIPGFAYDIATTRMSSRKFKCAACGMYSIILRLPCPHEVKHRRSDEDCFKETLKVQLCFECGEVNCLEYMDSVALFEVVVKDKIPR